LFSILYELKYKKIAGAGGYQSRGCSLGFQRPFFT